MVSEGRLRKNLENIEASLERLESALNNIPDSLKAEKQGAASTVRRGYLFCRSLRSLSAEQYGAIMIAQPERNALLNEISQTVYDIAQYGLTESPGALGDLRPFSGHKSLAVRLAAQGKMPWALLRLLDYHKRKEAADPEYRKRKKARDSSTGA